MDFSTLLCPTELKDACFDPGSFQNMHLLALLGAQKSIRKVIVDVSYAVGTIALDALQGACTKCMICVCLSLTSASRIAPEGSKIDPER